jgi:hypothetical protein
MSHWSSGLPVCLPAQGSQVQIPCGDLCETGILLLALSRYKLLKFSSWYWTHLNISSLIFPNPIPLKVPELVMYACFWLDSSPSHWVDTESLHQLSWRGVRLHANWVNAEDNQHLRRFNHSALTQWRGVSICIDSVDVESHLALAQLMRNETLRQVSHRRMLTNLNKSANSRTKSKKFRSLIIWPICVW